MLKNSLIAAGLVGLVFAAQPALATPALAQSATAPNATFEVRHRDVSYADLDLSTAAGQARLDARLRHAASMVCESNYGPHPLSEEMEARRCYRNALQSAQQAMAARGPSYTAVKVAAR